MRVKQLAILGSTGSIGTQTLDVVRANPDRFAVYAICAHRNIDLLIAQAREFKPEVVCIAEENLYPQLKEALSDLPIKVWAGMNSIADMVTFPSIDIVVASMVGYAGLRPTMASMPSNTSMEELLRLSTIVTS